MSTLILDAGIWATICNVNSEINRNTTYRTDLELYGKPELWAFANGEGDCEDYALSKYRELLRLGFPSDALRLTLCHVGPEDGSDANHAVLAVITDMGRFILDNRIGSVLHWQEGGFRDYRWVKALGPKGWVDLRGNNAT